MVSMVYAPDTYILDLIVLKLRHENMKSLSTTVV